jgi:arylsulfatase A-like enzyme
MNRFFRKPTSTGLAPGTLVTIEKEARQPLHLELYEYGQDMAVLEHQVQTVDLLPTILTMLGDTSSELFRSMQGYDLLSSTRREFTIAEQAHPDLSQFNERFPEADVSKYDRALKMIRTDNYKYIWASDGKHELYDLQADPDELSNIIKDYQNIADDLKSRLKDWQESVGA